VIRSGGSDEDLERTIRLAVWDKELKHYIGDKRFRRTARTMSMIGG
jgi:GTP 3',8-cyclase